MARHLIRKAVNELLNKAEFTLRRDTLVSYPPRIFIEPTNRCVLACPLCPTGKRDSRYPPGDMPLRAFVRLMSELGPRARTLHLYNWGEPLLHEDIWRMVSIAKHYGLRVWLSTTLNDLGEDAAGQLVSSGLDRLNVSIDGVTQETYERYRRGGSLGRVLRNLRAVLAEREKRERGTPLVRWQFLVTKRNEHEIGAARKMAESLGVDFTVKPLRLDMIDFNTAPLSSRVRSEGAWLPSDNRYNRYSGRDPEKTAHGSRCRYLWDRTVISWEGAVSPCCRVFSASDYFGSALRGGFGEVWNGTAYRHARRLFTGEERNRATVCDRCVTLGNLD